MVSPCPVEPILKEHLSPHNPWNLSLRNTWVAFTHLYTYLTILSRDEYTLTELMQSPLPEGVDPTRIEQYLSKKEFEVRIFSRHCFTSVVNNQCAIQKSCFVVSLWRIFSRHCFTSVVNNQCAIQKSCFVVSLCVIPVCFYNTRTCEIVAILFSLCTTTTFVCCLFTVVWSWTNFTLFMIWWWQNRWNR